MDRHDWALFDQSCARIRRPESSQTSAQPHTARLFILTKAKAHILGLFKGLLGRLTKKDIATLLKTLFHESVFLGVPTYQSVKGMYWRKKGKIPKDPNPERDRCGVLWLCPVVPFTRKDRRVAVDLMNSQLERHSFERFIALTFPSSRRGYVLPSVMFVRVSEEYDVRALTCHGEPSNVL